MYRGFKITGIENINDGRYYKEGQRIFDEHKSIVDGDLYRFVNGDNSLDGSKIQASWFPQIKCHVFISHSHKDKNMAIYLAGWLWVNFKIVSFIDFLVWGHADKLLKEIDDDYCKNENEVTYDYEKRNYSTSHVNMMLSTALAKMIDQTECLFFLETPNSIKPSDEIQNKTKSAWVYFEMTMTQLVKQRKPIREGIHETKKFAAESLRQKGEYLDVEYEVDLTHLVEVTSETLKTWRNVKIDSPEVALDEFYKLSPPKINKNTLYG